MDIVQLTAVMGNIGEFFGALLLLASLIYVGIQIKSNTQATRAAIIQQENHFLRSYYLNQAESTYGPIIERKLTEGEALTYEEEYRYLHWLTYQVVAINGYLKQFEMGYINEDEFVRDMTEVRQVYEELFRKANLLDGVQKAFLVHDKLTA